jgi:NADPH:quinone reductase-like Zn-dependent oxidoreductase
VSSETVENSDLCDLVGWVASHLEQKYLDGADFPDEYALDIINRIINDYNSHNYDDLIAFLADAVEWKTNSFKRRVWDALTNEEKAEFVNRLVRRLAEDGMIYFIDATRSSAFELDGGLRAELAKLIRNRYLNGLINFQNMINEVWSIIRPDVPKDVKLKWVQTGLELARYLDENTLKELVREYFED